MKHPDGFHFPHPHGMRLLALALLLAGGTVLHPRPAMAQMVVGASDQDHALIKRIEDHLNTITLLTAQFHQVAPDGKQSTGTAWLDRTNRRMRFQYDAPSPLLLVANHDQVVFNDSQLGQTTTMPMDKTPIGLLLRPHLELSGDVRVTALMHEGPEIEITLVRDESPGDGSLTLLFHEGKTLLLRGWIVQDAQGASTRVDLLHATVGGPPPPDRLFDTDIGDR
ncbi:LolA family protein [Novacetimonas pomaceti]|nr:outer membrane lipoprotein carrier protein LolA [Novacetimonas pomaceti]